MDHRRLRAGVAIAAASIAVGAGSALCAPAGATPAPNPPGSSDILGALDSGSAEADRATGGALGQIAGLLDQIGLGSSGPLAGPSGPPQIQRCNQSTQSGHDGITDTIHRLGRRGPATFQLSYDTENVPDRIVVSYQGRQVYDTGYVGDNNRPGQGVGSARVAIPAGVADSVLVRVYGGVDTNWSYTVSCPS
ncbi:hypothetical protein ACXVUM_06750 [Williamsia sp. SKLECPSW1]